MVIIGKFVKHLLRDKSCIWNSSCNLDRKQCTCKGCVTNHFFHFLDLRLSKSRSGAQSPLLAMAVSGSDSTPQLQTTALVCPSWVISQICPNSKILGVKTGVIPPTGILQFNHKLSDKNVYFFSGDITLLNVLFVRAKGWK